MKEFKEVEIRSEEVQEIMGQVPPWILRWGITLLLAVLLVLLIGSCFFRYPDVITTEMTLSSSDPVAQLVARSSGRLIHLYVQDGETVEKDRLLGVLENPANIEHVFTLRTTLEQTERSPLQALSLFLPVRDFTLGDIQGDYNAYIKYLQEFSNYRELEYYPKKIASVKDQIARYRNYLANQQKQHTVIQDQHILAINQYQRDSLLFERHVLSASEFDSSQGDYLQSQYSLEGSLATLENLGIQIAQLEENLLDVQLQQLEKEKIMEQDIRNAYETLLNSLNNWILNYTLRTPVAGTVTFTKYWNENQFVSAGETVFTVVPEEEEQLLGIAQLPLNRSGKVKTGQRVLIRFDSFPDHEFGIVTGNVKNVSLVPEEDFYRVEIDLPDGLKTNYGKELPVRQEMKASAEIVTEELTLIVRFFQPIKKIFREGFGE